MRLRFPASSNHHPTSQTLTLKSSMGSQTPPPAKRPFCPRCTKPLRVCLCSRLNFPPLDNPIAVTILQHSLERDHPLNSARVARLGLKNLSVVPVTDVNFRAHFTIVPNLVDDKSESRKSSDLSTVCIEKEVNLELKSEKSSGFSDNLDPKPDFLTAHDSKAKFDTEIGENLGQSSLLSSEKLHFADSGGKYSSGEQMKPLTIGMDFKSEPHNAECSNGHPTKDVNIAIFDKYQVAHSSTDFQITVERAANPDISWVLNAPIGLAASTRGFTVKRLQRKQPHASQEFEDFIEFNLTIPTGTALLFPSGNSAVSIDEVNFEVKHLIVLDGTWTKARRMYSENPWLQLLPHLKLSLGKASLYSEVRHQPKIGCLSTIESIVCAMKGLGKDMEGLDKLLDVFESMIGDQRRLKAENLRMKSLSRNFGKGDT